MRQQPDRQKEMIHDEAILIEQLIIMEDRMRKSQLRCTQLAVQLLS